MRAHLPGRGGGQAEAARGGAEGAEGEGGGGGEGGGAALLTRGRIERPRHGPLPQGRAGGKGGAMPGKGGEGGALSGKGGEGNGGGNQTHYRLPQTGR